MSLFTGLVLIFLLFVFHTVIRKLRHVEETHRSELNRVKQGIVVVSEWMAQTDKRTKSTDQLMTSLDHRIEAIMANLGMLPTPEEVTDVDPIEFHELEDERKEETIFAALPDYGVSKDWRDTPGYYAQKIKEVVNAD